MSISETLIIGRNGIRQIISCATIGRGNLCRGILAVMSGTFPNGQRI